MPTSVLLAVLAAAGLLALAPALTRRYDATERIAAERATSTARVLSRRRRRRTVPGRYPVSPPRFVGVYRAAMLLDDPAPGSLGRGRVGAEDARSGSGRSRAGSGRAGAAGARSARGAGGRAPSSRARPALRRRRPVPTALHRRRRVLLALVLLNGVELAGVALVGPGFWIGFSVSATVLLAYVIYLRRTAVVAARRRRMQAERMAWIAAEQAAVRREHARRAADRQAALRRAAVEREEARRQAAARATDHVERYTPRRSS